MEEKEAKMSEPEGEEDPTVHPNLQKHPSIGREITDVDLDLDQSWPFDPNPYASNPSSPLIFSFFCSSPSQYPNFQHLPFSFSSDQQSSPLWGFSDAEEEKPADSPLDGRFRLPDTSATTDYPDVHPCEFSSLRSLPIHRFSAFNSVRFGWGFLLLLLCFLLLWSDFWLVSFLRNLNYLNLCVEVEIFFFSGRISSWFRECLLHSTKISVFIGDFVLFSLFPASF